MEARRIRSGTSLKTKPAEFFDFFVLFSPQLTLFLHLSSQEWSCSESETWATPQMAAHGRTLQLFSTHSSRKEYSQYSL